MDEFGVPLGIKPTAGPPGAGKGKKGAGRGKQKQQQVADPGASAYQGKANGKYEQIGYGFNPFENAVKDSKREEINYDWV